MVAIRGGARGSMAGPNSADGALVTGAFTLIHRDSWTSSFSRISRAAAMTLLGIPHC